MTSKTIRLNIVGNVQGVGYRAFAQHEAQRQGLKGWVRNMADGSVEAVLSGPDVAIERVRARLAEGPPGSRVEGLTEERFEPDELPSGFQVRRAEA